MTDETAKSLALIQSQSACALIQCAAMQAENQQRAATGAAPAYTEANFMKLIDDNGLEWNAVMGQLRT